MAESRNLISDEDANDRPNRTLFPQLPPQPGDECERLVAAQRERGIPTWRDVDDLNTEPTESELRRIIRDASTANVILWITPETADSPMIRNVEAPVALERHSRNDGFFILPVAAGGLDYVAAATAIRNNTSITDLSNWNTVKLDSDPADDADIARVANRVAHTAAASD